MPLQLRLQKQVSQHLPQPLLRRPPLPLWLPPQVQRLRPRPPWPLRPPRWLLRPSLSTPAPNRHRSRPGAILTGKKLNPARLPLPLSLRQLLPSALLHANANKTFRCTARSTGAAWRLSQLHACMVSWRSVSGPPCWGGLCFWSSHAHASRMAVPASLQEADHATWVS